MKSPDDKWTKRPTAYGIFNIQPTKSGKENKVCSSMKLLKHIMTWNKIGSNNNNYTTPVKCINA